MKITIGLLICLTLGVNGLGPRFDWYSKPPDVKAADMRLSLEGPPTDVSRGMSFPIRLFVTNVNVTYPIPVSPLDLTIGYRLHIVDVASKRAYDTALVETLMDMPAHPAAILGPRQALAVAKYIPAIPRPGTYRITATEITVNVPSYLDTTPMPNTNAITVRVSGKRAAVAPLSNRYLASSPIIAGSWRCVNTMSSGFGFDVHYGRDSQGYYGRPGSARTQPMYYFLDGSSIVERAPNEHAVRYSYTLRNNVLERGPQTFWHEGGWASQPDVGTDTCRRQR